MREFEEASREVDATDCAADGDPRELLQRQGARVEVAHESLEFPFSIHKVRID